MLNEIKPDILQGNISKHRTLWSSKQHLFRKLEILSTNFDRKTISISISWFFLARSGKYRDGELYCVITSFVYISLIHYSLVIVNTRLPSQRRYLNGK